MAGRNVRNWLRAALVENWPVKLLSLIVAVVLWLHVLGAEDPQATQAVTVQVIPVNEPEGLKAINITPETVELRLRGRESALAQAQLGRIRVEANLRGATVGENEVPLRIAGVPYTLGVRQGHPTIAVVELDKVIERQRPVHEIIRGEPARGFVIEKVVVQPGEVTMRGATSAVREVARAVVVVDVSGINRSAPFEVEVEARDNRNVAVSGVSFEPRVVTVNVEMRDLNVKYVPVRPVLGSPPAGYRVAAVNTEPEIVTITSENELSDIRTVPTLQIDISGLRGAKQYSVSLNAPSNVRVEGPASVLVTVTTQAVGDGAAAPRGSTRGAAPTAPPESDGNEEDNGAPPENQSGETAGRREAPDDDGADEGADPDDGTAVPDDGANRGNETRGQAGEDKHPAVRTPNRPMFR